jgi:hypothetical protein
MDCSMETMAPDIVEDRQGAQGNRRPECGVHACLEKARRRLEAGRTLSCWWPGLTRVGRRSRGESVLYVVAALCGCPGVARMGGGGGCADAPRGLEYSVLPAPTPLWSADAAVSGPGIFPLVCGGEAARAPAPRLGWARGSGGSAPSRPARPGSSSSYAPSPGSTGTRYGAAGSSDSELPMVGQTRCD